MASLTMAYVPLPSVRPVRYCRTKGQRARKRRRAITDENNVISPRGLVITALASLKHIPDKERWRIELA
jgi:hypothetical protein